MSASGRSRARAPALTKACLTDAAVAKFASKMLVMTMGRLLVSMDAICCAAAMSFGKHLERGLQELSKESSLLSPAAAGHIGLMLHVWLAAVHARSQQEAHPMPCLLSC